MLKRRLCFALLPGLLALLLPALAYAAGDVGSAAPAEGLEEFSSSGWLALYALALGYGFLTSLTPCVYPMIPITVAIFGARDEETTRAKAFVLATCYVLGMGVMFSALGVGVALLGEQFGTFLGNPWVVIPLVGLFAALAASMFGAFELNLPPSIQARLSQVGGKGYTGALGMGLVGGLVAAPCTGPFLAGILAFVATTRNVVVGGTLLFTYAVGIGVLFWAIAVFALALPKSGRWMEWIKSIGGIALVAVAVHFLRPIVPLIDELTHPSTAFLAGAIVVAVIGALIGAIHLSFHAAWPERVRKAFGVVLMVVGITGVVSGVLTPEQKLDWQYDEQAAFAKARAEGKGVMIDFAATWCAPCKELELTFADPDVYRAISDHFVPLKFDVTEGTDEDEERQERWRAETLPAVIFVTADGVEIARVREYQKPGEFMATLGPAAERIRAPVAHAGAGKPAMDKKPAQAANPAAAEKSAAAGESASGASALTWLDDDQAAFTEARKSARGVFIDFSATWCAPCQEMDDKTFADAAVASELGKWFVPVRFDVTGDSARDQAIQARYRVEMLPAMIFLDAGGNELGRLTQFTGPKAFLAAVAEYSQ